jgi:MFS superfamily sulfate permease-like transporter
MAVITIAVMLVKEYLPLIGRRWPAFKLVPSPLVAIFVSIVIEYAIVRPSGSRTPNINDVGPFLKETAFPMPFWMQTRFYDETKLILDGKGWGTIFSQGILLFCIGTVESLMVIEVMNQFTATVGHNNQHMAVLGLANVISGTLGGAGGDAMIGVTTLNGLNGAEGRVSSVSCGIGIMLLIMVGYPILNFIPVAAIGGIMFVVVIHIFKWYSIDMLICAIVPSRVRTFLRLPSRKVFRSDVAIIVVIVVLTFYYNQLYGILAGIGINFLVFALQVKTSGGSWTYLWRVLNTPIHAERTLDESGDRVFYYVRGPLYFKSFRVFKTLFDYYNDPPKIVIYMEDSRLYDYSSLDGLNKVCKLYKSIDKSVEVMNLSETSKLIIQKSDGSRGYCCCSKSFGFQWMLGDIVVGESDDDKVKPVKPKDDDDTSNTSKTNSAAEPEDNNSSDRAEAGRYG